jgi:hypothetical protein
MTHEQYILKPTPKNQETMNRISRHLLKGINI